MYVGTHVCMRVCMYVCMHACMYVCMCVRYVLTVMLGMYGVYECNIRNVFDICNVMPACVHACMYVRKFIDTQGFVSPNH